MATAIADDNWRVKYSDGEGLVAADLSDMQTDSLRGVSDGHFMQLFTDGLVSDDPAAPGTLLNFEAAKDFQNLGAPDYGGTQVFTPYPQSGYWIAGGSARTLTFIGGNLGFIIDEPWTGTTDTVFAIARFSALSTLTTAVGDATNPRIDLVEVKAAYIDGDSTSRDFMDATSRVVTTTSVNKSRKLQLTYQIKQGTPAATPTYPTPSAGFCAMTAVLIPPTHNAVHSPANIRDMRYPIGGYRSYDVMAHNFYRQGASPWTLSTTDFCVTAPASPSFLYVQSPISTRTARLVGIGLYGVSAGSPDVKLKRMDLDGVSVPTITTLAAFTTELYDTAGYRQVGILQLADKLGAQAANSGTRASNSWVGCPIWANAYAGGPAVPRTTAIEQPVPTLWLEILGAVGSTVHMVRWYFAQGL